MIFRRAAAGLTLAFVSIGTFAACKGQTHVGGTTVVTVTVPAPSPSSSVPASGASGSLTASSAAATSAAAAPTGMTKLPGACDTLLASPAITDVLGKELPGKTAFVVGTPEKSTGRITYINCRYGIGKNPDDPALEIGISLYKTAGQAAARIPLTITDFENNSATAAKTSVEGIPATYLTGGQSTGYGPSVVLSYGQRTFALTFRDGVVPAAEAEQKLDALTALAINRTAAG